MCCVYQLHEVGAWNRKFHVAAMQRWLKSVMHVQSCRFVNINLRIFCRSRYRRRRRCLSSVLLWSKHFATMVTWRHTSLSSVSLGATLTPEGNWRQCLSQILEWRSKSIMVCYGIFCSGSIANPLNETQRVFIYFSTFHAWLMKRSLSCLVLPFSFRLIIGMSKQRRILIHSLVEKATLKQTWHQSRKKIKWYWWTLCWTEG